MAGAMSFGLNCAHPEGAKTQPQMKHQPKTAQKYFLTNDPLFPNPTKAVRPRNQRATPSGAWQTVSFELSVGYYGKSKEMSRS
jgi:hypothetical protein